MAHALRSNAGFVVNEEGEFMRVSEYSEEMNVNHIILTKLSLSVF